MSSSGPTSAIAWVPGSSSSSSSFGRSREGSATTAIDRELERSWQTFLAYTSSREFDAARSQRQRNVVSEKVAELGEAMNTLVARIARNEDLQARQTKTDAERA